MEFESIVLFLHIAGAVGIFVALGLEWTGLRQLRGATTFDYARSWMGTLKNVRRSGLASMLATVVTGIYMTVTDVGPEAWIIVTMGSLALVIILAQVLTAPRMAGIGRALFMGNGNLSAAYRSLTSNPVLWISIQTRVAIALGIVFLKIAQPGWAGSLLTISVAIVLGVVSALPVSRRETAQVRPVDKSA